jgi:hypothetical protein
VQFLAEVRQFEAAPGKAQHFVDVSDAARTVRGASAVPCSPTDVGNLEKALVVFGNAFGVNALDSLLNVSGDGLCASVGRVGACKCGTRTREWAWLTPSTHPAGRSPPPPTEQLKRAFLGWSESARYDIFPFAQKYSAGLPSDTHTCRLIRTILEAVLSIGNPIHVMDTIAGVHHLEDLYGPVETETGKRVRTGQKT